VFLLKAAARNSKPGILTFHFPSHLSRATGTLTEFRGAVFLPYQWDLQNLHLGSHTFEAAVKIKSIHYIGREDEAIIQDPVVRNGGFRDERSRFLYEEFV
jgi:hypothetical protein